VVFKSLGVSLKGVTAAAMKDIEILPNGSGVPTVTLHGDAKAAAQSKGMTNALVSLAVIPGCASKP
jgi:fatty acid synthase subunit alpha, fungi type